MSVITAGVVADLSSDDYHAESVHWSSSQLKAALPERYKAGGSQEALDFGTLVHSVVLEPDTLDQYAVLDAAKIGLKSDGTVAQNPTMTAAWKKAVAEAEQSGKKVVALDDWNRAHEMAESIRRHPEAVEVMWGGEGQAELSAFAATEAGVPIKARFDRLIPGAIVDLKTTGSKPGADSLTRTVLDFGYDLSAAHYLHVAELLDLDAPEFLWVFVEKAEPYRVTVAAASPAFIERGRHLRDLAIERLTTDTEPYEGATGRLTLHPPGWARIEPAEPIIPADFTWSPND